MSESPEDRSLPTPAIAYVSAVLSFLFVLIGVWIGSLLLLIVIAPLLAQIPPWLGGGLLWVLLLLGPILGSLSAWSAFAGSKRKARERATRTPGKSPPTPAWRRGVVVYPIATVGTILFGTLLGYLMSRDAMDRDFLMIAGAFLGALTGFLGSAIYLTIIRDYFPLPVAPRGEPSACLQCGEPLSTGTLICAMCGATSAVTATQVDV